MENQERLFAGRDQNACLNVQPFFQSEQPYAVFPLMIIPLPQIGHAIPIIESSIFGVL